MYAELIDLNTTLDIEEASQMSVYNVNKCIIGLTKQWSDSKLIINAFFPWLELDILMPNRQSN